MHMDHVFHFILLIGNPSSTAQRLKYTTHLVNSIMPRRLQFNQVDDDNDDNTL
jgi:hypothetical protein